MRIVILVLLWAALGVVAATMPSMTIDLDAPGAMEALKLSKPDHHARVVEIMKKVQAVPTSGEPLYNLKYEPLKPDITLRHIETSFPAKTRLSIAVDDTVYKVTVVYNENPATLVPAK